MMALVPLGQRSTKACLGSLQESSRGKGQIKISLMQVSNTIYLIPLALGAGWGVSLLTPWFRPVTETKASHWCTSAATSFCSTTSPSPASPQPSKGLLVLPFGSWFWAERGRAGFPAAGSRLARSHFLQTLGDVRICKHKTAAKSNSSFTTVPYLPHSQPWALAAESKSYGQEPQIQGMM